MNLELNNSVIILTFGFGSVDQNTKEILQDIAEQNTGKYGAPANTSVGDITVIKELNKIKTVQKNSSVKSKGGYWIPWLPIFS